ncbi:vitellogenin-A2 [Bombina bombina]|uniref:vitellogenin-A2 n=1 Tax=Bombina bombina TaxID=8345 RepID=UPI00235B196F|nr:vitellogenin-A2 [Bombina bombina]XP_053549224.1 vitellogenin-A2 [Bombina bombina]
MRGIILAFLLAVAGSERSDIEPVFSQSKTIVYNYEAVILNGFPENGLARSGIKVNCKFEIKSFAQRMYLLKIQSPEIKEYNGVWPKDPFTLSTKLTKIIADQLTKPVKFEYHNGRVGNIYASDDVSDTVVNIYRGILNLFQMTIKKTQNVYDLQESSIGGVCHTRYVVQEDRRGDQIIVDKSTDLNNCQDKVSKIVGIAFLESCIACKHLGKNVNGTATYTYKMKKMDQGALIMEVSARQIYHYSPFAELNGTAVMEARQVITWAGTKGGQTYAPQIQLQNRGGLHYQVTSEVYQIPIHLMRTKSPEGQIGIRGEGLEKMLRKRNVPFSEYPIRKTITQIVKTLVGWKALPSQIPLLSGYIKIFGQELSFSEVNKKFNQTIIQALNEPAERHTIVRNVMNKLLGGFAGQ